MFAAMFVPKTLVVQPPEAVSAAVEMIHGCHRLTGSKEDSGSSTCTPIPVQNGIEKIPLIPELEVPVVVDGGRGQDAQAGGEGDGNWVREQLGPHGTALRLAPTRNIRLIRDESRPRREHVSALS